VTVRYSNYSAACVLLAATMLGLFSAIPAGASEPETRVVFAVTLPTSILGRGAAVAWDDLLQIGKIAGEKEDVELVAVRYDSWFEVIEALKQGEADFAWLPPFYFARALYLDPDCGIEPVAVYESNGSIMSRTCFYMMPAEDIAEPPDEELDLLFGARLAFADESGWVMLNLIFHQSGYRFEPYYFFHSFQKLNNESSALAMLFGELDAVVVSELSMEYLKQMDKRLETVEAIGCTSPMPNPMIARGAHVSPAKTEKVLDILTKMHEDPEYSEFRHYFETTGGRWIPAEATDFARWHEIYKTSIRRGWDKAYNNLPLDE